MYHVICTDCNIPGKVWWLRDDMLKLSKGECLIIIQVSLFKDLMTPADIKLFFSFPFNFVFLHFICTEHLFKYSHQQINCVRHLETRSKCIKGSKDSVLTRSKHIKGSKDSVLTRSKRIKGSKDSVLTRSKYIKGSKDSVLTRSKHIKGSKDSVLTRSKHIKGWKNSVLLQSF